MGDVAEHRVLLLSEPASGSAAQRTGNLSRRPTIPAMRRALYPKPIRGTALPRSAAGWATASGAVHTDHRFWPRRICRRPWCSRGIPPTLRHPPPRR
jgi:hypothetical protein